MATSTSSKEQPFVRRMVVDQEVAVRTDEDSVSMRNPGMSEKTYVSQYQQILVLLNSLDASFGTTSLSASRSTSCASTGISTPTAGTLTSTVPPSSTWPLTRFESLAPSIRGILL